MDTTYNILYSEIKGKREEISESLKRHFVSTNILIRKEENRRIDGVQFLIELIDKTKIDSDDYGIVFCLTLRRIDTNNTIIMAVELLHSDGPIIEENQFLFDKEIMKTSIQSDNAVKFLDMLVNKAKALYAT